MNYLEILDQAWQDHLKSKDPDAPTVISLFAGGGGSSLGYSMAGYRELLAIEWDDNAVATFKLNFPDVPVYHGDIARLSVDECMKLAGLTEPGQLDLLDGSPPCQGFSVGGKRLLNDPRNRLFREYIRLLRGLQPKVFVAENVPGLVQGKMKAIFAEIMRELKTSGYRVKCQLMNTKYFYVPQSRQRLIFIGTKKDMRINASFPKAEASPFGFAMPETRTLDNKATDKEAKSSMAHAIRHKRKGNGFAFQVLTASKPAPTWPKLMIKSTGAPRFVVNGEHWFPSEIELKGIGGFPLCYKFSGDYENQWAIIGNSVPPLFMRSIANHIKQEILTKIDLTHQDPVLLSE